MDPTKSSAPEKHSETGGNERDIEAADVVRTSQQPQVGTDPPFLLPTNRRVFGIPPSRRRTGTAYTNGTRDGDAFIGAHEYNKKYPPDPYGEEMGPEARIWKIYTDEATEDDRFRISNLQDTLEVILVFAGLFSAVVTSFVLHTVENLEDDWQLVTASLLAEMTCIQRSLAYALPLDAWLPSSNLINYPSGQARPSASEYAVNGLFFTSLAVALCTALAAVLAKQWIHHHIQPVAGNPQDRARRHQFRHQAFSRYQVEFIVGLLPVLIHVSLFLFSIGLSIFLSTLHYFIAALVVTITGTTLVMYLTANILPIFVVDCPYRTPVTNYIFQCSLFFLDVLCSCAGRHFWTSRYKPLKEFEGEAISRRGHYWDVQCLSWLQTTTTDARVHTAACQAFAGIPPNFSKEAKSELSRTKIHSSVFEAEIFAMLRGPPQAHSVERIARALALSGPLLPPAHDESTDRKFFDEVWQGGPLGFASLYSMLYSLGCAKVAYGPCTKEFQNFFIDLVIRCPEFLLVEIWESIFALATEWMGESKDHLALRGRTGIPSNKMLDQETTFQFLIGLVHLFPHLRDRHLPAPGSPPLELLEEKILRFIAWISSHEDQRMVDRIVVSEVYQSKFNKNRAIKMMGWILVLAYIPVPSNEEQVELFNDEVRRSIPEHPTGFQLLDLSIRDKQELAFILSTAVGSLLEQENSIPTKFWIPMYDLVAQMCYGFRLDTDECDRALADLKRRKMLNFSSPFHITSSQKSTPSASSRGSLST